MNETSVAAAASMETSALKKPTISLKSRVLVASSWTLVAYLLGQVLRFGGNLITTRLLAPEVFGVMAIAHVAQLVLTLLSDLGLRQSIIHSPRGERPEMLNTAWTVQIVRGVVIWGICLAIALGLELARRFGWLAEGSTYASPELPAVLAAMSLSAVLQGFQSTRLFTTNRSLDNKYGATIELAGQVTGLLISIVLGWLLRSVWAFVAGALVSAAVVTLLSHVWVPGLANRLLWNRDALRELVGYGRWVLLSSVMFVLASNADRLLLGAWVSPATLGVYGVALQLATLLEGVGSRLFTSVGMPAFSEVERSDPVRFRRIYFRARLTADLVFLFGAGLVFSIGPALIQLLYDPRYEAAGPMMQLLSFSLFFARYGLTRSAYMALGQPRYLVWINGVRLVSILVMMPLLYAAFGLTGAIAGVVLHALPTLPLMHWLNRNHGLNDLRFELKVLVAWPVGYACGEVLLLAVGAWH